MDNKREERKFLDWPRLPNRNDRKGSSGHEKRPQKPKIRPYESLSQSEREMYRRRENEAQTLKKSELHYDSSLFFCFYLSL